jgi:hypothetical protein
MARVMRFHKVGGPEVLQIEDVEVPLPGKGEVQIRIKALGLNAPSRCSEPGSTWKTPSCPLAWVTRRPSPLPRPPFSPRTQSRPSPYTPPAVPSRRQLLLFPEPTRPRELRLRWQCPGGSGLHAAALALGPIGNRPCRPDSSTRRLPPQPLRADQLCLHPQAGQLAQRGGVQTELPDQPMPVGPPDWRPGDAANRNCRVVNPRQRGTTSRRLAIHHRQSKG